LRSLDILSGALSAGFVVVCGASYAACLALGRLRDSTRLIHAAWLAYAGLAFSTLLLASALRLHGGWWLLVATMLIGYGLLPRAIWHLSAATHRAEPENSALVRNEHG
jgi:hypothetical protein